MLTLDDKNDSFSNEIKKIDKAIQSDESFIYNNKNKIKHINQESTPIGKKIIFFRFCL